MNNNYSTSALNTYLSEDAGKEAIMSLLISLIMIAVCVLEILGKFITFELLFAAYITTLIYCVWFVFEKRRDQYFMGTLGKFFVTVLSLGIIRLGIYIFSNGGFAGFVSIVWVEFIILLTIAVPLILVSMGINGFRSSKKNFAILSTTASFVLLILLFIATFDKL